MRKLIHAFRMISAIVIISMPCYGVEFHPMGLESLSMGGTGVASAGGGYAAYYNPALLSSGKYKAQMAMGAGVGYREINLTDSIDTLSDIGIAETLEAISALGYSGTGGVDPVDLNDFQDLQRDLGVILAELEKLSDKNGFQIMPTASLGVRYGNFGIGVYGISEATAYATIDRHRLDIIVQVDTNDDGVDDTYVKINPSGTPVELSSPAEYYANSLEVAIGEGDTTHLNLTGATWVEVPVAYGHAFSFPWGDLSLGGAFKIMSGRSYDEAIRIDTESGEIDNALEDSEESDVSWGVDLGVLFNPAAMKNLTAGLVVKNVNTPSFETALGNTLDIEPQVRAGVAYDFPDQNITCALDMDLSKNETFMHNYEAQYIGFGTSFHPYSWFSLRGGLMQNIQAGDEEGLVLTAGIGLGVKWLQVDLGGQYSLESGGTYDGQDIPRYGRVQVAVVSKWF